MAAENTRAFSIEYRHTGAGSHEAAQADPDACLGGYMASNEFFCMQVTDASPSLGSCAMTIEAVSEENGAGAGTLTATDADTVTWTPPGGSAGAGVAIANGETKVVEGNDTKKAIMVTRNSATAMSSSVALTIVQVYPNAPGFDDVSSAEQAAGDDEYRTIAHKVVNPGGVTNVKVKLQKLGTQRVSDVGQLGASGAGTIETSGSFADWPESGWCAVRESGGTLRECVCYFSRTDTVLTVPAAGREALGSTAAAGAASDTLDAIPGMRIENEDPSPQETGSVTSYANEDTAPGGITFEVPIEDGEALALGDYDEDEWFAIHEHREIPVGASAVNDQFRGYDIEFDAS